MRLSERLFNPNGVAITARDEIPGNPAIYSPSLWRNKCAAITPFQGWIKKWAFFQGFHPWLLYCHPVGVEEPIT
jgi:hypothetical protein